MAWRLACDKDSCGSRVSIDCLMLLAGEDFEPFAGVEYEEVMFYFEGQLSLEHVEELVGVEVRVASFAGAGGEEFFDDAQVWRLDEVPAITVGALRTSPFVMFGGCGADDLFGHVRSSLVVIEWR